MKTNASHTSNSGYSMTIRYRASTIRSKRGTASFVDLAVALSILLLVVLSIADLITISTGCSTCYLIALESCAHAADSNNFQSALQNMSHEASALTSSPLGKFGRLRASTGYLGSGTDLYLIETNIHTGKANVTKANTPLSAVDPGSNIYLCQVKTNFSLEPYWDMSALPALKGIPGLSKPLEFSVTHESELEHPENFVLDWQASSSNRPSVGATVSQTTKPSIAQFANWDWHDSNSFSLMPGQTVFSDTSLVVPAQYSGWTKAVDSSGAPLEVKSGQRLSILVNQNENWQDQYNHWSTAAGDRSVDYYNNIPIAGLTAKIGDGEQFFVGDHCYNLEVQTSGQLSFRFNDSSFQKNDGVQRFKVLTTN